MQGTGGFHPLLRDYFARRFGSPTSIQSMVWPVVASKQHLLALAPTGSGKTLAAFYSFINDFVTGRLQPGTTRLLYVSPLKALNNDIRRNLLLPLEELQEEFRGSDFHMPEVRVLTRSGDTPQSERNRMKRHPPEILITTPESLNLLLTSGAAVQMFTGLKAVIVDEIHALAPNLRGAHLMTAVERLEEISGPLQRIGLSATVANPQRIARFLGGWKDGMPRPVQLLHEKSPAPYQLDLRLVWKGLESDTESVWDAVAAEVYAKIQAGSRLLCFAESRRVVERVATMINDLHQKQVGDGAAVEPVAFAYHGSLSREIRLAVEERFKAGRLRCVVATSALELGIDIGNLDEVVMLQCPSSVASAMQRLGRAGHRPGEVSRGTLYPLHNRDLLNGVVLQKLIAERSLEPVHPPSCPLDLLAQILVSMACEAEAQGQTLSAEKAWNILRRSDTYQSLNRDQFDLTLQMLLGSYQGLSFPGLRASLQVAEQGDPESSKAMKDVALLPVRGSRLRLYQSGGTIPERGLYRIRIQNGDRTVLGELDEEFVWERRLGDRFVLGSRLWQIRSIGDSDVEVLPATGWGMNPFWKADSRDRENGFADAIAWHLSDWSERLNDPSLTAELEKELGADVAEALLAYLKRQRESVGQLPGRHRVVVEVLPGEDGSYPVYLHTFWGGRRNRPFAMALSACLEKRYSVPIPYYVGDDGLLLVLPVVPESEEIFSLPPELLNVYLETALPESGLFGARFRECASVALLLPRRGFGRRTPLWLLRASAGRLLETLSGQGEFPVTVEVYRSLLVDCFDLQGLKDRLEQWQNGQISVVLRHVEQPTPFAAGLDFQRINELTYEPDRPGGPGHRTGYFEALSGPGWVPLPEEAVGRFEGRSLRLEKAYAPESDEDLQAWLAERGFIPEEEWLLLCQGGLQAPADRFSFPGATEAFLCSQGVAQVFQGMLAGNHPTPADVLLRFLYWYGPVSIERIQALFGDIASLMLEGLDSTQVVQAPLIEGREESHLCVKRNLEAIYRLHRRHLRLAPPLRPLRFLSLLLASMQNISAFAERQDATKETLQQCMERLFGAAAPVTLWEQQILPARIQDYSTTSLDALFGDSLLCFTGAGKSRIFFFLEDESSLFLRQEDIEEEQRLQLEELSAGSAFFPVSRERRKPLLQALADGSIASRSTDVLRSLSRRSFQSEQKVIRKRRWQPQIDFWSVPERSSDVDALALEEQNRRRVQVLLDRYGILFRELLQRELPALRWSALFRTLCRMELAGEVYAGSFFEGLSGLQFLSAEAWQWMQDEAGSVLMQDVWWINACDPASLCGLGLSVDADRPLPARIPGNRLIYRRERLAAVEMRGGRGLLFYDAPENVADLKPALLALLYVDFNARSRLLVEQINGMPALQSPYRPALEEMGFQTDGRALVCHRDLHR